ncbi:MAG: ArsR/SmtB family transcription factor [Promethearchaeota archaeon]
MTDVVEDLSQFFKALADPTRLKLLRLLMFNDENKLKVIDIADKVGISQPAITQHINILKELGLIKSNKEQNRNYYYVNRGKFKSYKRVLNTVLEVSSMKCTFKGKCSECPLNPVHNNLN